MRIHNLSNQHSVINTFLFELRSLSIQKDSMRFRRNIERIGEAISYEMSKSFSYATETAQTPLGEKSIFLHRENLVVCSILRAGLPLHQGILNYFDKAENAFISAYRKHKPNSTDFEIKVEYIACPDLEGKTLIMVDPMLATGQSIFLTYEALLPYGAPAQVHVASVIGSKHGVDYLNEHLPDNTQLWIGDIDDVLDEKGYIVPGLGDAGDLAFGVKLQQ